MNKNRKISVMIKVCGWVIISNTMLFFLLPVSFSASYQSSQMRLANVCAEAPFAMYAKTVLQALAVSPAELLILGDNPALDLIISYFWRLLVLCCGFGILRKNKHMYVFFLTLVSVSIVLLVLNRFLQDGWGNASSPMLQNDLISLLIMFMYIAFFKFPPVQKEFT